jgi:hypothetical protein
MGSVTSQSAGARRRRRVVVGIGAWSAGVALAACGSSGSHSSGLASRSPHQIVDAAQAALRSAKSFVAAGTLHQGAEVMTLRIVNGGGSKLDLRFDEGGKSAEIIATGGSGYVRGNEKFWSAQAAGIASRVANRWIELPSGASKQFTSGLGQFAPHTLARCLGENLGRLSHGGSTTVNGTRAVVIRQAGNAPGSNPGTLAVAATGPAYPLRVTSTGPSRPGGKIDACNDGKASDTQGSLTLSDFDHAPAVVAPKHAVKVSALAGSSA